MFRMNRLAFGLRYSNASTTLAELAKERNRIAFDFSALR